MKKLLLFLLLSGSLWAQAPVLFFTDLTSGPKSGGENNKGTYVTIYGNYFGVSRGASTVTVGGGLVDNCPIWTNTEVTCQIGANAATGNIVVSVGGSASNGIAFTVRSGTIRCVSTTGNNANSGLFPSSCWATIPFAAETGMAQGDITYVRNGVVASADDGFGSPLNLSGRNGTALLPYALVVYPGEVATIGAPALSRGIIQFPSTSSFWTLAGFILTFTGSPEAIHLYQGSGNWNIIGNSISCPNGDGFTGCVTTDGAPFINFWGNTIHDTGATGADKTYHAFYFGDHGTTGNNMIDVGWNTVYNIHGCRGIMFHSIDSTPGAEGFNLTIHDNLIHDVQCDGIALANVNPDKGPIKIYNNVLYRVGTGPDPAGLGANYSCFYTGDTNGTPTTPVEIYNNTCYDGGSRGAAEGDAGAFTAFIPTRLRNNVIYELAGEAYITASTASQCSTCLRGDTNLWFGLGNGPTQTTSNLNANPLFVNISTANFHLQAGSPAIHAGTTATASVTDFDGLTRPSPPSMGAFETAGVTLNVTPASVTMFAKGETNEDSIPDFTRILF